MRWLAHNPIADMYGPAFLFFYAVVIGLTLAACWMASRWLDWTESMPLPMIPSSPDPHEIAYLRAGENEVARSVIFALLQRGLLQVRQQGSDFLIERAAAPVGHETLKPIERHALDWFAGPQTTSEIFRPGGLPSHLTSFCGAYEQHLGREHLLNTPETNRGAQLILWGGALLIFGLGTYKTLVAFSRGRFNVLFLIILGAAGLFFLFKICRLPRLSRRGRAYLERLHLAFDRLKYAKLTPPLPGPTVEGEAAAQSAFAFDPTLPLLVGLFGVGALAGTPYDFYQQPFRRAALNNGGDAWSSSSTGCGSSSSSSSDSSSSGGDGGGGSSCSSGSSGSSCGGSSCGGGCGGCGS